TPVLHARPGRLGAAGGHRRDAGGAAGPHCAARRERRRHHRRARSRGHQRLGDAAVPVPRGRLADPPPRDSLRPLRAPHRRAARRPLHAARARRQVAAGRHPHPDVPPQGRRMNEKVYLEKASAPAAPPAKTAKPLPDDALILIPMRNTVLFPGVISPITVGRVASVAAAQEAVRSEKRVGFLLQRDPQTNDVKPEHLHWVGTAGQVVRYITGAEGTHHLVVQGQSRFRVLEFLSGYPYLAARVQFIEQKEELTPEVEARFLQLKAQAVEAIQLLPNAPEELTVVVQGMTSPALLADMVANLLDIKNEDKQDLLETFDLKRRLDKVLEHLSERVGVLRISKEIGDKTKKEFDERQREHVLRE